MSHSSSCPIPILIVSTLKPVRDVRAFEKLALSLGETNKYQLNIIGFSDERISKSSGTRFFSGIRKFNSLTDRILFQFKFAYQLIKIRPKLLVCCSFELIPLGSFFKPILNYKLVYDVQENYLCNLNLNPTLLGFKKKLYQNLIQWAERMSGIDLFLLAEKCYEWEMPEKKPFLVLENKYQGDIEQQSRIKLSAEKPLRFCVTGTLSPFFGTLEGIRWFKNLIPKFPMLSLEIIGHCPLPQYFEELKKETKGLPQIQIRVSSQPISHEKIIHTLRSSDVSLLPYQLHPCIRTKMPTKLFECAALGVPVFITPNPIWEDFLGEFQGGFSVDFNQLDQAIGTFHLALEQVYFNESVKEWVLWKSEKVRFQQAVDKLLSE